MSKSIDEKFEKWMAANPIPQRAVSPFFIETFCRKAWLAAYKQGYFAGSDAAHRAMKDSAEAAPEVSWRPIDTAPKDGEIVLLLDDLWCACDGSWSEQLQAWISARGTVKLRPTHWMPRMPLPEQPE